LVNDKRIVIPIRIQKSNFVIGAHTSPLSLEGRGLG